METLALHVERYEFAATHARPGTLLDLACGVGYGTRLLADRRPDLEAVLGVDVEASAIEYARRRYADDRVRFERGDTASFGDGSGIRYATIVSLETLEHLAAPGECFGRLANLLEPGGVLVASVPTTPSVDLNPHHRHDFTARTLRTMGASHGLVEVASHSQVQSPAWRDLWGGGGHFPRRLLRPALLRYYFRHPRALGKRLATTLRYGLSNHYLTLAWRKDD